MKILSIRAPWWWHILYDGKDIENRVWKRKPSYRGPLLIQASQWWNADTIENDYRAAMRMAGRATTGMPAAQITAMRAMGGHLVGMVDLVDVVRESGSPWFVGPLGLKLATPFAFPRPIPITGQLGLFDPAPDVIGQVNAMRANQPGMENIRAQLDQLEKFKSIDRAGNAALNALEAAGIPRDTKVKDLL